MEGAKDPPPARAKKKKHTNPKDDPKPKKANPTKPKPDLSPDHVLTKAVRLDNAANKAQSDSMSIEQAILENPQWKKLNNEAVLTDLRQAKDLLTVQMKLPFWQKLRLSDTVKKWKDEVTQNHSAQEIKNFVEELETAEKALTSEMSTIKKAQQLGKRQNS